MQQHDKPAFGLLVTGYLQEIYEKSVSPALLTVWFETLKGYEIGDIEAGFARYVAHPEDCRFPPKPGDIIRHLPAPKPEDDGRPSADEGMGPAVAGREGRSRNRRALGRNPRGLASLRRDPRRGRRSGRAALLHRRLQPPRAARAGAARTGALDRHARHRPALREERIGEAVKLGRIGHDHAISLLPGPSATSIEQVAGLLEGPDATPDQQRVSRQLRGLLEIIRAGGSGCRRPPERGARGAPSPRIGRARKALAALESRGIKPGSAGTDEAAA
ncbi:MAG: hypothetical protein IPN66_09340 [Candidatus Competibacteraceae bacterium]|nr:hypothetical protein [Candidatus Competibacteraceae bacterium]